MSVWVVCAVWVVWIVANPSVWMNGVLQATAFNHKTSEYKIESWKQRKNDVRVKLKVPKFVYSHEFHGPVEHKL